MRAREIRRKAWQALGAALWVWALGIVVISVHTVRGRVTRAAHGIELELPAGCRLAKGDVLYLATEHGYQYAGEVSSSPTSSHRARAALDPLAAAKIHAATQAYYWETPLSAEASVRALLPPAIGKRIAETFSQDWQAQEAKLGEVWRPLVTDVALAYADLLAAELAVAWRRHEDALRVIGERHFQSFLVRWPALQERARPILERHLIPLLGELIANAVSEAPKVEIAWLVAQGKHAEAYARMLDWLAGYLATIPEADRERLARAVDESWQMARDDEVLISIVSAMGREVADDDELRAVLATIYREAVADNPRTAEFLRGQILESPEIRGQMYALLEAFAPTARTVLGVGLFDTRGRTRPEVVQMIRSLFLGRRIAWITLEPRQETDRPIEVGAVLRVERGDERP
jgi:hypothetical protein